MPMGKSRGRGCLEAVVIAALLLLGTCQVIRYSEQSDIRAHLPAALGTTHFVAFDVCDRMFGGYSYIIAIPPEVSQRVLAEGPDFLKFSHYAPSAGKAKWEPTELYAGRGDGTDDSGLPGLLCLRKRTHYKGERLIEHIFRKGGYIARGGRESVIIIPSLNIVIGGFDPR
jgi:hypothetical protein